MTTRGPNRLQSEMIFNLRQSFGKLVNTSTAHFSLKAQVYIRCIGRVAHAVLPTVNR